MNRGSAIFSDGHLHQAVGAIDGHILGLYGTHSHEKEQGGKEFFHCILISERSSGVAGVQEFRQ